MPPLVRVRQPLPARVLVEVKLGTPVLILTKAICFQPGALHCADIKSANQKQRNERLNRSLQNFLYGCIGNEGEAAAKPALAVLTELWRRHVWRDARTANVIGAPAPPPELLL